MENAVEQAIKYQHGPDLFDVRFVPAEATSVRRSNRPDKFRNCLVNIHMASVEYFLAPRSGYQSLEISMPEVM